MCANCFGAGYQHQGHRRIGVRLSALGKRGHAPGDAFRVLREHSRVMPHGTAAHLAGVLEAHRFEVEAHGDASCALPHAHTRRIRRAPLPGPRPRAAKASPQRTASRWEPQSRTGSSHLRPLRTGPATPFPIQSAQPDIRGRLPRAAASPSHTPTGRLKPAAAFRILWAAASPWHCSIRTAAAAQQQREGERHGQRGKAFLHPYQLLYHIIKPHLPPGKALKGFLN